MTTKRLVSLIGMFTAGKTKVGIKLSECLDCEFVDLDDVIVEQQGAQNLQQIVDMLAPAKFKELEEQTAIETVKMTSKLLRTP